MAKYRLLTNNRIRDVTLEDYISYVNSCRNNSIPYHIESYQDLFDNSNCSTLIIH